MGVLDLFVNDNAATQTFEQRQQFGGSIAGPLLRDKLLFFANYDQHLRTFPLLTSDTTNVMTTGSPSKMRHANNGSKHREPPRSRQVEPLLQNRVGAVRFKKLYALGGVLCCRRRERRTNNALYQHQKSGGRQCESKDAGMSQASSPC